MRHLNSLSLFSAITLLLAACSTPPPPPAEPTPAPMDMGAAKAEIQGMEDAYAVAMVAKDADGVMAYYADDVVSYSRDMEPAIGKGAMRQRIADGMAKDSVGVYPSFTVMELYGNEDHLTEIGSWVDKDSTGTEVDHGTYFSIFKKNGDKWECIRDISVSAVPKK